MSTGLRHLLLLLLLSFFSTTIVFANVNVVEYIGDISSSISNVIEKLGEPFLNVQASYVCECIGCSPCTAYYMFIPGQGLSSSFSLDVFETLIYQRRSVVIPVKTIYNVILFFLGALVLARAGDKLLKLNPLNTQEIIHLFMILSVLPFVVYIALQISNSITNVSVEVG